MNVFKVQSFGLILLIVFGAFLTFMMYNGLISIHRDEYACFGGKHYINAGGRERLIGIGNVNIFYQPLKWDCQDDHKYDPAKYRIEAGQLVGRPQ